MSYCRFSEGDVYAYACDGGVQFWVTGKKLDRLCNTYDSAYQYAKYLRDECGLDVPGHAIDALRLDALDEANHGDGSAVKELISENNKLRDAMFSNAKKHALHHMDEDELRIWATQQAEYIEELKKLVLDAWGNGHPDKSCGECEIMDECHEHMKNSPPFERCLFEVRIEERMRELGVTDD